MAGKLIMVGTPYPTYSRDLLDFFKEMVPWQEVWLVMNKDKMKHGWRVKYPEVGGFYRLDYHTNMKHLNQKPEWLGDFIQIIGKERKSYLAEDKNWRKKRKYITTYKYKNLTKKHNGSFEALSLFAGSCTKVSEMEYLLYAKENNGKV